MIGTLFDIPIRATGMMPLVWLMGWVPLTLLLYRLSRRLLGVEITPGWRQWPNRKWRCGALLFVVVMLLWPWWGVVTLSLEADRLCRTHSGLHVFKTLAVEGVRTDLGIEWAAKRGFKYVERGDPKYPDSMYRETMVAGKPVREQIIAFTTRNGFAMEHTQLSKLVVATRFLIRDLETNEILADAVRVSGYYSFFDRLFWLGLVSEGWDCGNEFRPKDDGTWSENDVIEAALRPFHSSRENNH